MNEQDTELLDHHARTRGFLPTAFREPADVYVINSCTVTHQADREARRLARFVKRRHPEARVVVTGCYAEVDPGALEALPEVDLVVGNLEKPRLLERLEAWERGELEPGETGAPIHQARVLHEPLLLSTHRKVRPRLKVQDGCDHHCTFCLIPRARGRSRSRPPEPLLEQLRSHAARRVQEVVLAGIHLASYGRDLSPPLSLDDLLGRLAADPALPRIRLSSLEPVDLAPASVELLGARPDRFCRHLHMAVQSGSDRVLERMRRGYRRDEFLARAREVFERIPGVGVGLDLLVGFPGETEADFQATRTLVQELPFASLHVFPYSPRERTPAARMPDRVPESVVRERVRELLGVGDELRARFLASQLGRPLVAIPIQVHEAPEGLPGVVAGSRWLECLTDNYLGVHVPLDGELRLGDLVEVVLEATTGDFPRGRATRIMREGPRHAEAFPV